MAKKIKGNYVSHSTFWNTTVASQQWKAISFRSARRKNTKAPEIGMPPEDGSAGMKEIRAQIALGTLKNPAAVASVVKECDDPKVLDWAKSHRYATVRAAAAGNPRLGCGLVLKMLFFDRTKAVKMAAADALGKHHHAALLQLLDQFMDFPQYSLPLNDSRDDVPGTVDQFADVRHVHALLDAVQRFRAIHEKRGDIPPLDLYTDSTTEDVDFVDDPGEFEEDPF